MVLVFNFDFLDISHAFSMEKAMDYINLLHASGMYEKQTAKIIPFRNIDIFENAVSAETDNFLVDGPKETVRIDESILPEDTTFGVRISGDSMEPEFHDGQIAWVLQQESVANGEIGIFALNGEAYIKKLQNDKDGIFLISLDEKCAPIKVGENDRLDIFGKVLGKSDASAITGHCRCYRIQHQNCRQDRTWGQYPICRIYAADIKVL